MPDKYTLALALEDFSGGLILLWAAMRITTTAGFRTMDGRWALFRRVFYCAGSIALVTLGLYRFDGQYPASDALEFSCQSFMVFLVTIFPVMRALRLITQDQLNTFEAGSQRPR